MNDNNLIGPEETPQQFADRNNLPFMDYLLLSRALTHRSYLNENPDALEDNERLEFLGDAVLDFIVAAWLYNHFPELKEGDLTRLRSALVRTEQLAEFGKEINLGAAIRLGVGEGLGGGRRRQALLCGTFEALIGALYLDAGLEKVREFVEPSLVRAVDKILVSRADRDPKSVFQEWVQSKGYGPPNYLTVSEQGPDHDKVFEVEVKVNGKTYGRGRGHTKQAAAKAAAREAIAGLDIKL
ncbi:MAG: ribonuclease III [Anaerolineales bacterium]|jgi:ribonuclease-3